MREDIAEPATAEDLLVHETSIYGRVVGLLEKPGGGFSVNIDRDDGGRVTLDASEPLFQAAVKQLQKPVHAVVEAQWDQALQADSEWRLLAIEPFREAELVDAMGSVRAELDAKDAALGVEEMLRNLRA